MPRYATVNILDKDLLPLAAGINSIPNNVNLNRVYSNLAKDIKLSWDNDLVFDKETMDYKLVSGLEALAQRLYLKLSVQKGRDHTRPDFGWDFEYIIDRTEPEVEKLLPILLRDFVEAIKEEDGVLDVEAAEANLVHIDEQISAIKLFAIIIPKNSTEKLPIGIALV